MYTFNFRVGETIRIGDIATLVIHSVEEERILLAVDCERDIEILPVLDDYPGGEFAD